MKPQAHGDEYEFVGTLERSETGRWAIKTEKGRLVEITSGEVIEIEVAGYWIRSRIEHDGRDYIAMVSGVRLYRGMKARQ